MPKAIPFTGSNIVIAENQAPYLPLPARVFGDNMGTILCCWEFSEEELEQLMREKKLWSSHWSFNMPFQPMMLSVDMPVVEIPEVPHLTLYGNPAEYLAEPGEQVGPVVASDIKHDWKLKGWKGPGWYFWNQPEKVLMIGPYDCQMTAEKQMLKFAHDHGECNGPHGNPPCSLPHLTKDQECLKAAGLPYPDDGPKTDRICITCGRAYFKGRKQCRCFEGFAEVPGSEGQETQE